MARIGKFKPAKDGYEGAIRTLTMNTKARIVAVDEKPNDNAPDFRVFGGDAELGAAWKARSNGDDAIDYLRVTLDDPSFVEPVYAALFEKDGSADLVWNRKKNSAA